MKTEYAWDRCQTCGAAAKSVSWAGNRCGLDVECSKCIAPPCDPEVWDTRQYAIRAKKLFALVTSATKEDGTVGSTIQQCKNMMIELYGKEPK